jgi:hypothetical protein
MKRQTAENIILAVVLIAIAIAVLFYLPATLGAKEGMAVEWSGSEALVSWHQDGEATAIITKCRPNECALVAWEIHAKEGPHIAVDPSPWPGGEYSVSLHSSGMRTIGPVVLPRRYWLPLATSAAH